eukprot:Skav224249  [mRNA]  locus=scaffold939:1530408:1551050:- [translate_table: standard]
MSILYYTVEAIVNAGEAMGSTSSTEAPNEAAVSGLADLTERSPYATMDDCLSHPEVAPPPSPAKDLHELSLKDRRRFLTFADLPWDSDLEVGNPFSEGSRHWCLVAEIEDVGFFLRVRLHLRDIDNMQFKLHVHIKDPFSTMKLEDIQKGNTVAVLCAEKHAFMDVTVGIRQENPDTIYIFRCSHQTLIQESAKLTAAKTVCFGCGASGARQHCLRCHCSVYCNKECQRKHWLSCHKQLCSQMLTLKNLLNMDFSRSPAGDLVSFTDLSTPGASQKSLQLPRPCLCGFQALEMGNGDGDECPFPGFDNHFDFPPASLLPSDPRASDQNVNTQFYFNSVGEASRQWVFAFEVLAVEGVSVRGGTRFGETVIFSCEEQWPASHRVLQRGNCILAIGAFLVKDDLNHRVVKVRASNQIFALRTATGIAGLLNVSFDAEARLSKTTGITFTNCQGSVNSQRETLEDMAEPEAQLINDLVWASAFGFLANTERIYPRWNSFQDPQMRIFAEAKRSLFDDRADPQMQQVAQLLRAMFNSSQVSETEADAQLAAVDFSALLKKASEVFETDATKTKNERKTPSDLKALLHQLLEDYPDGLRCGLVAPKFEEAFGYKLDYKAAGFKTLRKLLEANAEIFEVSDMPMKDSQKAKPDLIVKLKTEKERATQTREASYFRNFDNSFQPDDDPWSPWSLWSLSCFNVEDVSGALNAEDDVFMPPLIVRTSDGLKVRLELEFVYRLQMANLYDLYMLVGDNGMELPPREDEDDPQMSTTPQQLWELQGWHDGHSWWFITSVTFDGTRGHASAGGS